MVHNRIRMKRAAARSIAQARAGGERKRCIRVRTSSVAHPSSSASSAEASAAGVERKNAKEDGGEDWEEMASSGVELLVDIDDVLSDVNRAGGFASVVFGPDSPLVEGEVAFMNVEEWREIKMDFSEEDKNTTNHDDGTPPMIVDTGRHDTNLLAGSGSGDAAAIDTVSGDFGGGAQSMAVVSAYDSEQGFKELDARALRTKMDMLRVNNEEAPIIIDVRSPEEFRATNGSIVADAVNVPIDELSIRAQDGSLDMYRGKFVVMVCGSGLRSAQATVRLSKLFAFDNVHNLVGGLEAAKAVFEM